MKNTKEALIGDVFHDPAHPALPLEGFKASKSMVFAGVYPLDGSEFEKLSSSLNKLTLNDASVSVARETSVALGQGFRLGFLGMLHLDVFRQRLEEDYGTNVIITSPCVPYQVTYEDDTVRIVDNPADFPARDPKVISIQEPFISSTIMMPETYLGPVLALCEKRRGIKGETNFLNDGRLMLSYRLPLSEGVYPIFCTRLIYR
jgi:translation elongation factor EF-4